MSKLSSSSISSSSTANVLCQFGVVVEMKTSWSNPTLGVGSFVAKLQRHKVDVDISDGMMMKCQLKIRG
ncbi:hypothetical protein MTR67_041978 [Solanum verrucosum]|uniref:Uncharacterized protein n=1 Tax=Solanum verrucosum TaxID=315347 RepID=A0AAF0UL40_SOLVR|nr:hypothetical protein MTR67_041978 [Solanum verrucosum]